MFKTSKSKNDRMGRETISKSRASLKSQQGRGNWRMLSLLCTVFAVGLLAAGCEKEKDEDEDTAGLASLAGTQWENFQTSSGVTVTTTLDFYDNSKVSVTTSAKGINPITVTGTYSYSNGVGTVTLDGSSSSFTVNGNILTLGGVQFTRAGSGETPTDNPNTGGSGNDNTNTAGSLANGDYLATTQVKEVTLPIYANMGAAYSSAKDKIARIYESFDRMYCLGYYNGQLYCLYYERISGSWKHSYIYSDMYINNYHLYAKFGIVSSLSGINYKPDITDIIETISADVTHWYLPIQPNYGYIIVHLLEDDTTWQYIRLKVKSYTTDSNGTIDSVTIQYQIY